MESASSVTSRSVTDRPSRQTCRRVSGASAPGTGLGTGFQEERLQLGATSTAAQATTIRRERGRAELAGIQVLLNGTAARYFDAVH
jgi:hypothetical protein